MNDKKDRIKELVELLNRASKAYYSEDVEIMSNYEYDALYDELEALEAETGIVLANSPTVNVGYESAEELVKERHDSPMLSLDKTKEPAALAAFLGTQKGLLSWKLDGLTIVLTYENGSLVKAVTRGNGEIGEVVTSNARTFVNLPLAIPYKGRLVVRGESVIKYSDFQKINERIEDADAKYKNPRNLCSGSVRQLDPKITAERSVNFFAFSLESTENNGMLTSGADGTQLSFPVEMAESTAGDDGQLTFGNAHSNSNSPDFKNSNEEKFKWLKSQGFDVVPYKVVTADTIEETVGWYAKEIEHFDVPSDGLVLLMDDITYGQSLGRTAKFPRNSIAFKWKDEIAETTLLEVEWSPSRTGLINPVAIFDPVELEGTTVSRASVHNVSIIEGLKLGIGDRITVYKANMIIPQIAENLTKSGNLELPDQCPACGAQTVIKNDNGVKTLTCPNAQCPAKKIKTFVDFVSRNAMNIEGISEETLEKFTGHGFISEFADIFKLADHKDAIINMPGFGEKSYENLIASIDTARETTPARVLNGLGIAGFGAANAKALCRYFKDDFEAIRNASTEELTEIEGVGDVLAKNLVSFFKDPEKSSAVDHLLAQVHLQVEDRSGETETLSGMTFVITGSLNSYANREELKAEIESKGGKVAGSVSSKTSYLINNDINSNSSKNNNAKKLGVPIITEQEYIEKFH